MIFSRILTRSNSVSMIASKFRSHEREIHNELHANQLQVSSQSPLDGGGSKNSISNLNRFSHGRYDAKNEINPLVSSAKTLPTGHPYPHLKARVLVPVSDPNQHHYQNQPLQILLLNPLLGTNTFRCIWISKNVTTCNFLSIVLYSFFDIRNLMI